MMNEPLSSIMTRNVITAGPMISFPLPGDFHEQPGASFTSRGWTEAGRDFDYLRHV
jgi:hypothetical protein